MKKITLGIFAFTALAGAALVSAQAPAAAPAQAPAATTAPAQATAPSAPTAAAATTAPTMTADEVVNKYLDAVGGKDTISKIKSMSVDASMQVMGTEAPSTTVVLDGVGMKQESEFNGSKIISVYTDKGGWMQNPMAGANDPTPMPDEQYNAGKGGIYVGGLLYDYAAKGSTIALTAQDDKSYTIKLTTKEKLDYTYVIDAKTFLVNTMTSTVQMQGQPVTLTTSYSDYKKTDVGFMAPYSMALDFGGQFQLTLTVKKVEFNTTIDPAVFAMPKA